MRIILGEGSERYSLIDLFGWELFFVKWVSAGATPKRGYEKPEWVWIMAGELLEVQPNGNAAELKRQWRPYSFTSATIHTIVNVKYRRAISIHVRRKPDRKLRVSPYQLGELEKAFFKHSGHDLVQK
jgi:hypothetical protein